MKIEAWLLGAGVCGLFTACSGTTTYVGGSGGANAGASIAGTTSVGGANAGTSIAGGAHSGGIGASSGSVAGSTSIAPAGNGGGTSSGGSTSSSGSAPSNVAGAANDADVPSCVLATFAETCGGSLCHAGNASAGVNLVAPGVASRLVNQPAQYPGVDLASSSCPTSAKLIDTTNRSASWLFIKLLGTQGACGAAMPQVGTLTSVQKNCLANWINTVQPSGT